MTNRSRAWTWVLVCGTLLGAGAAFAQRAAPTPTAIAPTLFLTAVPGRVGGHRSVAIAVKNTSTAPIQLTNAFVAERETPAGWVLGAQGVLDRKGCGNGTPPCIAIPAGATVSFEPWEGYTCHSCVCTRNGPVPAGRYRLVTRTCPGHTRVESALFGLPAR